MRRLPNGPKDISTPHYGRDEMAEYLEQAYGMHARLVYEAQARGKTTRPTVAPQLRSKAGRKEALLAAVRENPGLSTTEYKDSINVSRRCCFNYLQELIRAGLVIRRNVSHVGPGNNTRYYPNPN